MGPMSQVLFQAFEFFHLNLTVTFWCRYFHGSHLTVEETEI